MSLSLDKLEDSLRWATEKYGPDSSLVRSLQEQLRLRKEAHADEHQLDSLAEQLRSRADESVDVDKSDPALDGPLEETHRDLEAAKMDPLVEPFGVQTDHTNELPRFDAGERLGRRNRER